MQTGLGRARALRALAECGIPSAGLTRADSVTNEVWLTDEFVVRVNRDASLRLQREAILSQVLPDEVGYPTLVQYGGEVGGDWLILRRVQGSGPLSRAWPTMPVDLRREAVRQIADRLRHVHRTECPRLDGLRDVPHLIDAGRSGLHAVTRLLDALHRLADLPHVDRGLMRDVDDLVRTTVHVLEPFDSTTIVHGDLTFENVLWDGEQVTGLLDFEFARPGPPDLDLDVLLRFAALPWMHVAADYEDVTKAEDYADVPWWMAEDYPELFAHPHQLERVRLYSIAWDVHELISFPLADAPAKSHREHPYNRLARVVRGTSYLDRFNGEMTLDY
jgi:aminoglycoside phosphotransferase (APT) family kinase protein